MAPVAIPLHKHGGFFFANISVGSPPQDFNVMLDTGSAALWIVDSTCTLLGTAAGSNHSTTESTGVTRNWRLCPTEEHAFNSNVSQTAELGDRMKPVVYMDGKKVEGRLLRDTVRLGGIPFERTPLLLADHVSGATLGSGLLGLEYKVGESKEGEVPSFLGSMFAQSAQPQSGDPLFLIYLKSSADPPEIVLERSPSQDQTGECQPGHFGQNCSMRFSADKFTTQSHGKWYGSLRALGFSANSQLLWNNDFNAEDSAGAPALFDSGAGAIRVSSVVLTGMMKTLPDCKKDSDSNSRWHCACGDEETKSWGGAIFPSLSLRFESYENTRILGIDTGGSFLACVPPEAFVVRKEGRCYLSIVDGGYPHEVFGHEAVVLGMPILQALDVAYDVERGILGLQSAPEGTCENPSRSIVYRIFQPGNILVAGLLAMGTVYAIRNLQVCAGLRRCLAFFCFRGRARGGARNLLGAQELTEHTDNYRHQRISRLLADADSPMDDVFVEVPAGPD